jgi:hypothetical protein
LFFSNGWTHSTRARVVCRRTLSDESAKEFGTFRLGKAGTSATSPTPIKGMLRLWRMLRLREIGLIIDD